MFQRNVRNQEQGKKMSIKKELLSELTENQLKKLAEFKGIKFDLTTRQKKYYEGWDEKDKLIDYLNDNKELTLSDIENFIVSKNRKQNSSGFGNRYFFTIFFNWAFTTKW